MFTKCIRHIVLSRSKREVGTEDGCAWLVGLITVLVRSFLEPPSWLLFLSCSKIDIDGPSIKFGTFLCTVGFGSIGRIDKFNVAESVDMSDIPFSANEKVILPLGPTTLAVSDDASALEFSEWLKLSG